MNPAADGEPHNKGSLGPPGCIAPQVGVWGDPPPHSDPELWGGCRGGGGGEGSPHPSFWAPCDAVHTHTAHPRPLPDWGELGGGIGVPPQPEYPTWGKSTWGAEDGGDRVEAMGTEDPRVLILGYSHHLHPQKGVVPTNRGCTPILYPQIGAYPQTGLYPHAVSPNRGSIPMLYPPRQGCTPILHPEMRVRPHLSAPN